MSEHVYDVAIIGGGIVGLATTLALTDAYPDLRIVVLEKEREVGSHQTGHNSGVIHAGIYYKPGSLKARLCVAGAREMMAFCEAQGIRYDKIGKLIVATESDEIPRLETLFERATANGVPNVRMLGPEQLREIEPHAAGLKALHSPETAIVDYAEVARRMRDLAQARGVQFKMWAQLTAITRSAQDLRLHTTLGDVAARHLVNCAGLYSDRVARMMGLEPGLRIIPFRGEYYFLKPHRRNLVRGLIYPVADPRFPFLGVHFTRTVHGDVEAGPNAVLAFAREGYTMGRINPGELAATFRFPGFWRMARRFWQTGAYEFYRSLSPAAFARALGKLVPAIREDDLVRGGAGVRAQAVSVNGDLVDDFRFVASPRSLHVLNAPSPAATASLTIGRHIAGEAAVALELGPPAPAASRA